MGGCGGEEGRAEAESLDIHGFSLLLQNTGGVCLLICWEARVLTAPDHKGFLTAAYDAATKAINLASMALRPGIDLAYLSVKVLPASVSRIGRFRPC